MCSTFTDDQVRGIIANAGRLHAALKQVAGTLMYKQAQRANPDMPIFKQVRMALECGPRVD